MKALPINVYRQKGCDCTNRGISSRYDELLLVCDDGFIDIDESKPLPKNLVKIKNTGWADRPHLALVPCFEPDKGNVGWMMGGNFAYSSDSRFNAISQYPLGIHDRQETESQYNALSN
jgi:hypothetical protein